MQLFPTSLATVTGKATILHLPKRSKSVTENTTSRLWYKTCECRRKKNAFRHQKSQHLVRTGPISQHHGWAYHCRADVAQSLFLGVTSDTPWASEQVLLPVHADALVGISLDSTWGVCVCLCVYRVSEKNWDSFYGMQHKRCEERKMTSEREHQKNIMWLW